MEGPESDELLDMGVHPVLPSMERVTQDFGRARTHDTTADTAIIQHGLARRMLGKVQEVGGVGAPEGRGDQHTGAVVVVLDNLLEENNAQCRSCRAPKRELS